MTGEHTHTLTTFFIPIYSHTHTQRNAHKQALVLPPPCRDDFSLKLALLGNQWQGVVRRAQQRRGIIDSLVRQWQRYTEMAEKLRRWLQEVSRDPDVHQPGEPVALQQARTMLDQVQVGLTSRLKGLLLESSTHAASPHSSF